MNHLSKTIEKRKLKRLAELGSAYCGGAYFDERKGRYVRIWKSCGRKSIWAICKKTARKRARLYLKRHDVYTKKADDLWWNVY